MPTLAHVEADQGARARADLLRVITAEYREMPGLSVTIEQAARLWQSDRRQCLEVLEELTRDGFLCRSRKRYLRTGCGRS